MSQTSYVPNSVHLVGSIGLNGVEDVFSTVGPLLYVACGASPMASRVRDDCG